MNDFLSKIKFKDELITTVKIQKGSFVDKLSKSVDHSNFGYFPDLSDLFSSSDNIFKGEVSLSGFKLKRKIKFAEMNSNMVIASGKYIQDHENLIITTNINGFQKKMILYFAFLILFYLVFIFAFLFSEFLGATTQIIFFPALILHGAFMLGIPYFMIKSSVKKMKYNLEREFHYIANQ